MGVVCVCVGGGGNETIKRKKNSIGFSTKANGVFNFFFVLIYTIQFIV